MEQDHVKMQFLENTRGEITVLAQTFSSYISGVNTDSICRYLVQFDSGHMATAMKMLQHVDFYDGPKTIQLAQHVIDMIRERNGGTLRDVHLCPMTVNGNDSAGWMTRLLRNLDISDPEERRAINQGMMQSIFDLEGLVDDDSPKLIVLLDHFVGSGSTIISKWGSMRQWQNDNHEYIVVVLVSYEDAIEKIKEETDAALDIVSGVVLPENTRAFHRDNHDFSDMEKDTLKQYCEKIESDKKYQYGYSNSQSLVIFRDRAPNNALPVLHKKKPHIWTPLFPRHFP